MKTVFEAKRKFNAERVAKAIEKETPAVLRFVRAMERPKVISQKALDTRIVV